MPDQRARQGKIARLPVAIRNEVNRRLFENEPGAKIVAWLNTQDDVLKILDEFFCSIPVSPQNLSEWRQGGYQDWLRRQERVENLKDLSQLALKLAEASGGGNISDGSAAVAGGRIMEILENAADKDLDGIIKNLTLLRLGDAEKEKIEIRRQTLKQRGEVIDLMRKKFQRQTAELFLKWYDDKKVKETVESRGSNAEKIEELGKHIFGEDW
jgi:hypothetical protein